MPWVSSIWRQRESVLPDFVEGHDGFVKTLPAVPGLAVRLSAEMTSAPGAEISGFGHAGRGRARAREPAHLALGRDRGTRGRPSSAVRESPPGPSSSGHSQPDVGAGNARPARAIDGAADADDVGMRRGQVDGALANTVRERRLPIAPERGVAEPLQVQLGHAGTLEGHVVRAFGPLAGPDDDRAARRLGNRAAVQAGAVDDARVVVARVLPVLVALLDGRDPLAVGTVETDLEVRAFTERDPDLHRAGLGARRADRHAHRRAAWWHGRSGGSASRRSSPELPAAATMARPG